MLEIISSNPFSISKFDMFLPDAKLKINISMKLRIAIGRGFPYLDTRKPMIKNIKIITNLSLRSVLLYQLHNHIF